MSYKVTFLELVLIGCPFIAKCATVTYTIHDEFGSPVTNAIVTTVTPTHANTLSWTGPIEHSKYTTQSDALGLASCDFPCPQGIFHAHFSADGYYSEQRRGLTFRKAGEATCCRTSTDKISVDVLMRRIIRPTKMIETSGVRVHMGPDEGIMYFDMCVGDRVAPAGGGKVPDVRISYKRYLLDDMAVCTGLVSFVNGGAYPMTLMDSSRFKVVREADVNAKYQKDFPFTVIRSAKDKGKRKVSPVLDKGDYWVFRIREGKDDMGNVVFAHYGVVFGRVFTFDYFGYPNAYVNPVENDTNLEDDSSYRIQERENLQRRHHDE